MKNKNTPATLETRTAPPLSEAPGSAVDFALNYAAYAADWRQALNGQDLWGAKFGSRAKGDELIGRRETETRPDACMRILAAEVIRLRSLVQPNAVVRGDPTLKPSIQPDCDSQGRSL